MQENTLDNFQEAPPMSGESVPFKDLENNEKMPASALDGPITSLNSQENQITKPKNKIVFYLSLIGGIFIFIVLLLFILSTVLKIKNRKPIEKEDKTGQVEQKKESTISAVPKQITDKFSSIEKNVYDDNYEEIDVAFPQIEWKIEFEE